LFVSILKRNENQDLTGDPWNGRTLEWTTSSPPAVYNFAVIPRVNSIDAFTEMKEEGKTLQPPDHYEDIHVPRNTIYGLVIGVTAFLFGFAMVWYIWWLAITSMLGTVLVIIIRSVDDDTETIIPAEHVKRIEEERFLLSRSAHPQMPKDSAAL
jgi:cytochrome o ubiquinol oxidase subunit I